MTMTSSHEDFQAIVNVAIGDNFIIGGYYDDVFVRTSNGWRIQHRVMQPTWRSDNANVVKK